jgi:hypothetical protein
MNQPKCRTDLRVAQCTQPSTLALRLFFDPGTHCLNKNDIGEPSYYRTGALSRMASFVSKQAKRAAKPLVCFAVTGTQMN